MINASNPSLKSNPGDFTQGENSDNFKRMLN